MSEQWTQDRNWNELLDDCTRYAKSWERTGHTALAQECRDARWKRLDQEVEWAKSCNWPQGRS